MLLSSVNFVAKPKVGKNKDRKSEKKVIEKEDLKTIKEECEMCKKERDEESAIFQFPSSSFSGSCTSYKSSGYNSQESLDSIHNLGDRVTVATGDDFCLSVDQFYYTIGLRDEAKSDSTCVFRKRVLDTKPAGSGVMETVVFALDCDQDFYLTTNKHRALELNFYGSPATSDVTDERTFLVHRTALGHCFLQPALHKNFYLHHLDSALSVQQLDLNWRCPEEYFFHFNAIPEPLSRRRSDKPRVCTHRSENTDNESSSTVSTPTDTVVLEISDSLKIQLPTRKVSSKNKRFLKNLFVGCFSGRSRMIAEPES